MRTLAILPLPFFLCLAAACSSTIQGSGGSGGGSTTTNSSSSSSGSTTTGTGGSKPCEPPPEPQSFEVGTGEACFERLSSKQIVPMIQGPQGGFHLWLAVGCTDCGSKVTLAYGVKDPATGAFLAGTSELKLVLDLTGTTFPQHAGVTAFLPGISWDPMTVLPKGTHVLLSASVLDDAMQPIHSGEVEVELGDIVMWSPPCDPGPTCGQPGGLPCCTDGFGDAGTKN